MIPHLERRPIVVAIAGPNGAGKSTFFHAHLASAGLRFVNADVVARELDIDAYAAAALADSVRREFLRQRESFVFETVFSDPVGEKMSFLQEAAASGYAVVLVYIGVSGPETCGERVAMRVAKGGHDVPTDRLVARYPRTLANLRAAIRELPHVIVFDNENLRRPFRRVAVFEDGQVTFRAARTPEWLVRAMSPGG